MDTDAGRVAVVGGVVAAIAFGTSLALYGFGPFGNLLLAAFAGALLALIAFIAALVAGVLTLAGLRWGRRPARWWASLLGAAGAGAVTAVLADAAALVDPWLISLIATLVIGVPNWFVVARRARRQPSGASPSGR
ncbi:hypothetical protein [Curtobacterium aurantiacum]|uniref:Histidinol dehydrogenase n=1 Tax=Curtobacterium aurantiacum TaxID=3236919 RepID=A0ABS5VG99_9MICO|nr:hypothetical protein [Curtobacterium flaccumfaciens]MBT1544720.1 hypothetical protein [Curtobacterium flaccumfaciens pv. flaccumfaciens]MBT1587828.1 hypothetical protein [Curtobacterium flaccumfaciens pv. flaccumfaciens]MBT1680040.1 hypothetical protein [Curtobacterium flaccumfaciens pv. flaccumfaciens]